MSAFDVALAEVLVLEGGYSDDPDDPGGETNHGITAAVARANGYVGSMRDIPLDVVGRIYKAQYWDTLRLDAIVLSSVGVATELFDTGVNCGIAFAGRCLQRALNAFNRGAADYPDVAVDGVVGPMTVSAFRRFLAVRGDSGETVLLRALNAMQGEHYIALTEAVPADKRFAFGWFNQRVSL